MSEAQQEYKPQFPLLHETLLRLYKGHLTLSGFVCRERLNGIIIGLCNASDDGVLSQAFMQNFWQDVQDVVGRVCKELEGLMKEEQILRRNAELHVSLDRLQKLFGGP